MKWAVCFITMCIILLIKFKASEKYTLKMLHSTYDIRYIFPFEFERNVISLETRKHNLLVMIHIYRQIRFKNFPSWTWLIVRWESLFSLSSAYHTDVVPICKDWIGKIILPGDNSLLIIVELWKSCNWMSRGSDSNVDVLSNDKQWSVVRLDGNFVLKMNVVGLSDRIIEWWEEGTEMRMKFPNFSTSRRTIA